MTLNKIRYSVFVPTTNSPKKNSFSRISTHSRALSTTAFAHQLPAVNYRWPQPLQLVCTTHAGQTHCPCRIYSSLARAHSNHAAHAFVACVHHTSACSPPCHMPPACLGLSQTCFFFSSSIYHCT